MNKLETIQKFANVQIFENILPFWKKYTIDNQYGGFYGQINFDHSIKKDAEKGLVLNARILWTFSAVYKKFKNPEDFIIATRAYEFINQNFYDKEFGGYFWSLTYDSKPSATKKQIYAQAFVLYALVEYFKATGKTEVLQKAKDVFSLMEKYSFDSEYKGYFEALNRDWSPTDNLQLSAKDLNEKKSMNTHLHVLEAYTSLFSVWKDPVLKEKLTDLIRIFSDIIVNPKDFHLILFFNEKWETKSPLISFGHDIEASWLMHEAAEILGDSLILNSTEKQIVKIAESTLKALTEKGGMVYEDDRTGNHKELEYEWWVQAEAVVGYLNAYALTGDQKYMEAALNVTMFIENYVADMTNGEWYFRVDPEGKPVKKHEKAGFWKCPYHNIRACLEIIKRVEKLK